MLPIFVGIACFTIALVIITPGTKEAGKTLSVILCLVIAIAIGGLTDVVATICFACNNVKSETTVELVESREIIALQDTSSASGRFFLGSGSYKNHPYYIYYYNTEYGAKYASLRADSVMPPVYINTFPEETDTPHINEYCRVSRKYYTGTRNPLWFSLSAYLKYGAYNTGDLISSGASFCSTGCRYEIFVPEGTILEDFNIDLS